MDGIIRRRLMGETTKMTSIDLGSDTQYNIAQLFHRLYTGEYATGTFTLTSALPNISTEVFDTGLTEVNGCFIMDLTVNEYQTANTPDYSTICYYQKYEGTVYQFFTIARKNNNSIGGANFLTRISAYEWQGGKLYVTASFGGNANFTPFYPNHEYRWIAW